MGRGYFSENRHSASKILCRCKTALRTSGSYILLSAFEQGHSGEAWNCAVSPNGIFVASCGSDKVVRMYERSNEPLVLEDEDEEERERLENELVTGETSAVQGQKAQSLPSRKTVNSEKAVSYFIVSETVRVPVKE